MHYKSLASIAAIGLALIAPLVSAHPADQPSKAPSSYKTTPPKITVQKTNPHKTTSTKTASSTSIPYIDYGECYRVKSPACDKAYDDALAEFKKENPDYDFNAEPYPDSKRNSNTCKCTGSLLDGGYKGKCQYGDGFGYLDICFPGRGMCCIWCCQEGVEGYADKCVPTTQDPNCPGYGPDSKPH